MDHSTASAYNEAVENLRATEYPMIQESVYLDHAGSTLVSKSLMAEFAKEMTTNLYGNPHSGSWASQLSTTRIEDIRLRLLRFFQADPEEYDLVFVANATAGVKLVVEGMRSLPEGYDFAYHQACHTSLVGAREEAIRSVCLDDADMDIVLEGELQSLFPHDTQPSSTLLFAYSAQSHMNGQRYPLSWPKQLQQQYSSSEDSSQFLTLLDAASYSATSQLDLSHPDFAADFVVVSLYKIFGFPDLGVLLVRRSAEGIFDRRKYFGGGTVDLVISGQEQWHAPKSQFLHERLEDGTLPFHNIMAVDIALRTHRRLFGSMDKVRSHTSDLTRRLLEGIGNLRHANGVPVCEIYTDTAGPDSPLGIGPIVSFNIRNSQGAWVSLAEFEKLANLKGMHVRTGGLCSPGAIAQALDLKPWEMRKNFSAGFRCGTEGDIIAGKPTGVIRASFGAMSTRSDVSRFVAFLQEFYVEEESQLVAAEPTIAQTDDVSTRFKVASITVYPIKSCGGYNVPAESSWEVRPEGLAWDREWCLLHQGSRQALSQKRCPKMALLRPTLDFERGLLTIRYHGEERFQEGIPSEVSVPLSANPTLFESISNQPLLSRVCGDSIAPQIYASAEMKAFFTEALGVPCVLARFPPGGNGMASRVSKARMPTYQQQPLAGTPIPGSFPSPPSPPDSDSEASSSDSSKTDGSKILLSNESPILMIHQPSVDALNDEIRKKGGTTVDASAFRANVVIDGDASIAYSEDAWASINIGHQNFKLLGACRRCQMVCINQETGKRNPDPFSMLSKTRKFDGKVYFGVHMAHDTDEQSSKSAEHQNPTIQVGQHVSVQ